MTRKVITVDQEANIFDAQKLIAENQIRHIPVVDKNDRLIGIVTDRDIRSAWPYSFFKESYSKKDKEKFSKIKIKDIMTINPITLSYRKQRLVHCRLSTMNANLKEFFLLEICCVLLSMF
jgi:acetoin utilization protein AcuB